MANNLRLPLLLVIVFILSVIGAAAQDLSSLTFSSDVDLAFFYGQGCPHCAKEEAWLSEVKERYPTLKVYEYEVYFNNENRELLQNMAASYGKEVGGVPTTFINGKMIVGFNDAIGRAIEQDIMYCIEFGCESCIPKDTEPVESCDEPVTISAESSPAEEPGKTDARDRLTIGAVVSAAAVDAINPCAFAVLIILLTTILAAGKRKRVLMAGLAFTISIYISYLLMGIGLFSALQAAGVTHLFYSVVAALAILVGLFNLKDYLWYGKWFIMEVPLSWRPKMKTLIKGVTSVPGAFLIGFVVSLFLLPCTSGPYIVILGLLAKTATKNYALGMLLLYNFIFVLPMLIITAAIYFGFTTTEKAEEWRTRKLKTLHLIAGVIMLLLGAGMFVAMGLGYV
ncbi:cytochrome c biogenesis protein [Candidatus Woesearchaeota archaeon]|nr:cytochrome c biogenesis protein [Candidatus Woesearchaeota archaeon]